MSSILTGKDILNVLNELGNNADLSEIVDHLSAKNEGSKTALLEEAKAIIDAGVRFGCIAKEKNKYRSNYILPNDADNEADSMSPEVKSVKSTNDLHTSSSRMEKPKTSKTRKLQNYTSNSSDDDDSAPNDYGEGFVPRFDIIRRSRSRSNGKRRSRRRSRRRRRRG